MPGADETVTFTSRSIRTSDVPTDPVCCPGCGGQDLVLNGHMSYPHEEVFQAGQKVSEETDWKCEKPFLLELFACLRCRVKYVIEGDDLAQLRQENEVLQAQLMAALHAPGVH